MGRIRVLVVDDSSFARSLIVAVLSGDRELEVVGEAINGLEAVEMVAALRPDVVTMDVDMPVMNGLDAIERIMASHAVPILVVTNLDDSETAYAAIAKGALELVKKPDVNFEGARKFIDLVKLISRIKVITHLKGRLRARQDESLMRPSLPQGSADRVVVVAASTGGPQALSVIASLLPADFPYPVLVAQHIADGFVRGMVEWFSKTAKIKIRIASEGEPLLPGTLSISPSERHMEIDTSGRIIFSERSQDDLYHPSCDRLLSSAARVYGNRSIGVILSGMGSDGVRGLAEIRKVGGLTFAQDEASSIVFGMPASAIEAGCVDYILSPEDIARELILLGEPEKSRGSVSGI